VSSERYRTGAIVGRPEGRYDFSMAGGRALLRMISRKKAALGRGARL